MSRWLPALTRHSNATLQRAAPTHRAVLRRCFSRFARTLQQNVRTRTLTRPALHMPRLRLSSLSWLVGALCGLLLCTDVHARSVQFPQRADSTRQHVKARQIFVRGLTEAFLDDHEAAISHFEQALTLVPGQEAVLSALSDSHAARDDLSSAIYYARQAYIRAPETPHYGLRLGALQRRSNRLDEAVKTYESVIDRAPHRLDARDALASTFTEMGELERAAATYEQLLGTSPRALPEIRLDLLRLYRSLNDDAGTERTLQALIELHPTDPLYRRTLGDLYSRQGRIPEAIAVYERLAETAPSDTDLLLQLATLYREEGQRDRAQALLDRFMGRPGASPDALAAEAQRLLQSASGPDDANAVETALQLAERARSLAPDNSEVLAVLGRIHLRRGDPETAAPLLEQAVQSDPRALDRWPLAVTAYLRAQQPAQAVAVAEEGLMLFPGQYALVRAGAQAHMAARNNSHALRRYREALRLLDDSTSSGERGAIHGAIARLLDRLSRPEAASEAYQTALRYADAAPEVLGYYALHLADRSASLDAAAEYAERAVAVSDSNAVSLHALGWVRFQQGRATIARMLLEQAVDGSFPSPSARLHEHLGDVHRAQGNTNAARRAWEQALEQHPDDRDVQEKLNAAQNAQR